MTIATLPSKPRSAIVAPPRGERFPAPPCADQCGSATDMALDRRPARRWLPQGDVLAPQAAVEREKLAATA